MEGTTSAEIRSTEIVNSLQRCTTEEEALKVYNSWSDTYDQDVLGLGYNAHKYTVNKMLKLVTGKETRILDVAAGTGLVGSELYEYGYTNVDALDPSGESLAIAEKKEVYKKLMCCAVGEDKLDIDEDSYDVVTACGCFGYNLMQPNHLQKLVRIVKSGGYIIVVTRRSPPPNDVFCGELRECIQQLKRRYLVNDVTIEDIPDYFSATERNPSGVSGVVITLRVC
uniref:Williams-Beuren syndrome chromosomal region 27 protein-like n=1 Tax=Saccoglossus kowalevskii TaxID=10224 RepID=A0ABM0M575_SACKO|nr:PREDICTED: Williams-Beuren syndrome chromosomal region 27 protein-like [Saccoglossus kowalevskii]